MRTAIALPFGEDGQREPICGPALLNKNVPKRQETEALCQFNEGQIRRPVLLSNVPSRSETSL